MGKNRRHAQGPQTSQTTAEQPDDDAPDSQPGADDEPPPRDDEPPARDDGPPKAPEPPPTPVPPARKGKTRVPASKLRPLCDVGAGIALPPEAAVMLLCYLDVIGKDTDPVAYAKALRRQEPAAWTALERVDFVQFVSAMDISGHPSMEPKRLQAACSSVEPEL